MGQELLQLPEREGLLILLAGSSKLQRYSCYAKEADFKRNQDRKLSFAEVTLAICLMLCNAPRFSHMLISVNKLCTLQKKLDQPFAEGMDEAHVSEFRKWPADGVDMSHIKAKVDALLNASAMCEECLSAQQERSATHMCGTTTTPLFLCDECVAVRHKGCKIVALADLQISLHEAKPCSLRPLPQLLLGTSFIQVGNSSLEWRVMTLDTTQSSSWGDWRVILRSMRKGRVVQNLTLSTLSDRAKYIPTTHEIFVEWFFAICRSWMLAHTTVNVPLYGLSTRLECLTKKLAKQVKTLLTSGSIDAIMQVLVRNDATLRWLPHLATMPESAAAKEHVAQATPARRKRKQRMFLTSGALCELRLMHMHVCAPLIFHMHITSMN